MIKIIVKALIDQIRMALICKQRFITVVLLCDLTLDLSPSHAKLHVGQCIFLHPYLSLAALRASFCVRCSPFRSSRVVSGQFFLGLNLPVFPSGTHFMTCLALLSSPILAT